ncbi:MAG: type II toxin-antitoxin system Phd/YefM family antitoxin [Bacteroides sp.]|nr:type II toxin-antitoxin system Phd/YefM family antitoxin [Bacteroides sp.]
MRTTTITDFRTNVKRYVEAAINDNEALLINRGNTAAVLISLDEYNSIKATESILMSSAIFSEVAEGIEQWKGGERIEVDIDSL